MLICQKLREICVDEAPQNPDEMILQCANEECRKWLHLKCIAEDAVQRASEGESEKQKASSKRKSQVKSQRLSPTPPALAAAQITSLNLKAEVFSTLR